MIKVIVIIYHGFRHLIQYGIIGLFSFELAFYILKKKRIRNSYL